MPDFNHKRLRPVPMADGNTAMHYLGYVQNVVAGQVLAELEYLDAIPEGFAAQDEPCDAAPEGLSGQGESHGGVPDASPAEDPGSENTDGHLPIPARNGYPEMEDSAETFEQEEQGYWNFLQNLRTLDGRFIFNKPIFPLGPNCGRDPQNPNRIIALASGYCFYHQGLITVKKLLNVRQDVDFHTGNITFVGDIVVHGDVNPGFSVTGGSILVRGRLIGGTIKARGNVVVESGVKGSPTASIRAGYTIRIASSEQATIITPGNLIIDGNSLHSNLFVGGSLIVKDRLQGGSVHAGGIVYVKEKLGHSQGAQTAITLGYNPIAFLRVQEIAAMQQEQKHILDNATKQARKSRHFADEVAPYQELATRKLAILERMRTAGWRKLTTDLRKAGKARVIVPGSVYPGVEISIGRASHKVIDEQRDVFYSLHEEEVVHGFPAILKNWSPASPAGGEDGA